MKLLHFLLFLSFFFMPSEIISMQDEQFMCCVSKALDIAQESSSSLKIRKDNLKRSLEEALQVSQERREKRLCIREQAFSEVFKKKDSGLQNFFSSSNFVKKFDQEQF